MSAIYHEGQGVPSDHIESHAWCALAAASGDDQAQESCTNLLNSLSIFHQAEAHRRAEKLFEKYGGQYVYTQPMLPLVVRSYANAVLENTPEQGLAATFVSAKAVTASNPRQIESTEMIENLA